jgi:hypothetical protein
MSLRTGGIVWDLFFQPEAAKSKIPFTNTVSQRIFSRVKSLSRLIQKEFHGNRQLGI